MRNILITFLLVFISGLAGYSPLFAQNQPVSRIHEVSRIHGQVQDRSGKAVSGANVFIKGTVEGTSSDENGHFSFETSIQGDTVLLVRHISMEDLEIGIVISESMPALALRMYDKTNLVGEVVVVADQGLVLLDGSRATTLRTM
ncbi:MAG TPA: carboxypeptidase-like regulatory domain-containing protein, partial [Sphingobacteriaceae bacterium]|nr:carboxypeptidase-like regulatory domain-containing protein [Sphingobacteriaceae bacterium]